MPHQAAAPAASEHFERAMSKHIDTHAPAIEKADLTIYWHLHVQQTVEAHPLLPGQIVQTLQAIIEMWVIVTDGDEVGMIHVNPSFPLNLLSDPAVIEEAAVQGLKALDARYVETATQKGWTP